MKSKVTLRPFRVEEVHLYHQWMTDKNITGQYVRGEASSLSELITDFKKTHWQTQALSRWICEDKSQNIIGVAQAWKFDLYEDHMEVGRVLLPKFRGAGLGTDLMLELFNHVFTKYSTGRIQAITPCDNLVTLRTWEKCGMVVEGRLRYFISVGDKKLDCFVGSILKSEWEAKKN
ncbi:MAG: hypothetical protein A4S09_09555 [Proteobacteria bacterium SG_bin7]|nr:MAG: hypothetical protein A4S09_09555 [Proteobacteria bacterium SG_bin7]